MNHFPIDLLKWFYTPLQDTLLMCLNLESYMRPSSTETTLLASVEEKGTYHCHLYGSASKTYPTRLGGFFKIQRYSSLIKILRSYLI